MIYSQFLANEQATLDLGARCATLFRAPATIYLQGDLGAGKTTFTRGFLQGLGHCGAVKSPTYSLVESYDLPQATVHHFDLYRFSSPDEWEDSGLDDLFLEQGIRLIEWPTQGEGYVPPADWCIQLMRHDSGRMVRIHAMNTQLEEELKQWQS